MKRCADVKVITLFATCILLVVGWTTYSEPIAITGGVLFLMGELAHLVWAYRAARFYHEGRDEEWRKEQTTSQKVVDGIWDWLSIVGLISMGVGGVTNNEAMGISGGMLWFGRILSYVIGGIITQVVAGIPLRMTYGGWKVNRSRRSRR
jgi:hypothetical protein